MWLVMSHTIQEEAEETASIMQEIHIVCNEKKGHRAFWFGCSVRFQFIIKKGKIDMLCDNI